jgi:hypothetical protein
MSEKGPNLALLAIAFLIGVVLGYMIRDRRRNYLTEFTRDTTGRIMSIMEREIR